MAKYALFEFEFKTFLAQYAYTQRVQLCYRNYVFCLLYLELPKMINKGYTILGIDDDLLARLTDNSEMTFIVLQRPYIIVSILQEDEEDEEDEEYFLWTH